MKHAREWDDWNADGQQTPEMDAHGWVTSLSEGATAGTVFLVVDDNVPVAYDRVIVTWEGTGILEYDWSASRVDAESTPGRDVVSVGHGNHLMRIVETDPADPIRRIAIVPEQYEDEYAQGEIFNPDWLARIDGFRAVRFMDWMGTNNSTQSEWADRPLVDDAIWSNRGVPLEVMIDLANRIGADPWFNIPHLATDEYIREFAQVVKDRLNPALTAHVEHSNEVWNWQFQQAQYANTTGRERWGDHGDAYMQWHGMRTATICDIWKNEVFAGETQRVFCVLGTQAGWRGLEDGALNCPLWVAEEEGREPCYAHGIDAIGITGYFSGCLAEDDREEDIRSWFADADGGMAKGMSQLADGAMFECGDSVAGNADTYAYFRGVADTCGLAMVAYEGGQHITGNGHAMQDDEDFIAFHIALNRHADMALRYAENLNNWKDAGGDLFVHFVDIGVPSKWGSWGALEYLGQESSPKWDAIVEFNDQSCWWPGC